MKANNHFWSYLAQFCLEWEMFHTKVAHEIKTHILCSVTFFFWNCAFYGIMWKSTVELSRPQMTIWRLRVAYWINKDTHPHTICNTYCFSHCNNGWKNTPQCYIYTYIANLVKIFWSPFPVFETGEFLHPVSCFTRPFPIFNAGDWYDELPEWQVPFFLKMATGCAIRPVCCVTLYYPPCPVMHNVELTAVRAQCAMRTVC